MRGKIVQEWDYAAHFATVHSEKTEGHGEKKEQYFLAPRIFLISEFQPYQKPGVQCNMSERFAILSATTEVSDHAELR